MSNHVARPARGFTPAAPARDLLLRRKCACGTRTLGGSECESCAQKRVQRKSLHGPAVASTRESVHLAIDCAGVPRDLHAREAMAPGVGRDFSRLGGHADQAAMRSADALHAATYAVGASPPRIISRNPGAEVPTGNEIVSQTPSPTPSPAPAPAPAPPAQKCTVTSEPSYSPSGKIPVTTTGGRKQARFNFSASFGEAHGALKRLGLGLRTGASTGAGIGAYFLGVGALPGALIGGLIGGIAGLAGSDSATSCCEVRQFIKWDATSAAAMGGVPHSGFPAGTPAGTWIEDRDTAGTRYGRRTGPFSALGLGDQYTTNGVADAAKGNKYEGRDGPGGPAAMLQGEWQFQLKAVDTCHGDAEKASSSVITVPWS